MARQSFWISLIAVGIGMTCVVAVVPRDVSALQGILILASLTAYVVAALFAGRAGFLKGALLKATWLRGDFKEIERAEVSYAQKRLRLIEKVAALEKVGRTNA